MNTTHLLAANTDPGGFGTARRPCAILTVLLSVLLAGCGQGGGSGATAGPGPSIEPVLVGAGDVANCDNLGPAKSTAKLLDGISGTVFADGDLAYPNGTDSAFANCYDATWGRHKARTRPAVGNHEYDTLNASGYFNYWGAAAGDPTQGYYSYDLGAWHVVVLNSNCDNVGGCMAGSAQEQWLRADLAAHPAVCTAAYWHTPLFASSASGDSSLTPLWQALFENNVDVVINADDHVYERFAPQDPEGTLDPARGIREFIVGTGGASHGAIVTPLVNSEIRDPGTYGVLELTLLPTSYQWKFVPVSGGPSPIPARGPVTESCSLERSRVGRSKQPS